MPFEKSCEVLCRSILRGPVLLVLLLCSCQGIAADTYFNPVRFGGDVDAYEVYSSIYYLIDTDGSLRLEDVLKNAALTEFQPATIPGVDVNFGYTTDVYWLMIPFVAGEDTPRELLLEIAYPPLDDIQVHIPSVDNRYSSFNTGDLQAFAERPYPHRNFVFPFSLQPGQKGKLFIRVTSQGDMTIPVKIWQPRALHEKDQREYALLSLYYGTLVALLLYNFLLFLSTRDILFLSYVTFVAAMSVGLASLNGFGNQFLWQHSPAWGNIAYPSGMATTGFFAVIFTRLFLSTRQKIPVLDKLLIILGIGFAATALSPLVLPYRVAAFSITVISLIFVVVATASGWYSYRKGHHGARYFLLAWGILLLGVAGQAGRNMGWVPTTSLSLYSMQIGSALEMILLSFALAERFNAMRKEKEEAQEQMLAAKQTVVETLQNSEMRLELEVEKRTRELAKANRKLTDQARVDFLTGILNRRGFIERSEEILYSARRYNQKLSLLLCDLDHFKQVNDCHGHAAGDFILQSFASLLSDAARKSDIVSRIGGEEFCILTPNISSQRAQAFAERICHLTRTADIEYLGNPIPITVSIGLVDLDSDYQGIDDLLHDADQSLYQAKSGGRDRVVYAGQPVTVKN